MPSTNGNIQNGATFRVTEEDPVLTKRKLRIVCVGAGFGGLTLAHKIQHETKSEDWLDLQIYEKNADIGGTWYENTYPGAACDIPAHAYTFTFEGNPDWSHFYPPAPEVFAYIKATAKKYDLQKHVKLDTKVLETIWDDEVGKWKIKVQVDGKTVEDEADILVNGSGFLNKWQWPQIEGLHNFKGKLVHSARWDNSYDYAGRKVAVLGNGSSAIQIVPAIQPKVATLKTYVRNATWISVNFAGDKTIDGHNFKYTDEQRKTFREDPKAHYKLRKELEANINGFFFGMVTGHPAQEGLEGMCRDQMTSILSSRPDLQEKLIPKWHAGCRRLTPGDGYLEALLEPNTEITFDPILSITEKGIKTAEGEEEFDMIVCATGFDTSFIPPWKLVGLKGATLDEKWKETAEGFFAVQVDEIPNYYGFNGPNCPINHGSVLTQMSWTADYIVRWAEKIATQDIKSITPNSQSVKDFNIYTQEFLKRMVWADGCRAWYKNGSTNGPISGTYAGSILHFKDTLEKLDSEHFDIVHRSKNRFQWLGNGQSVRDLNGAGSLAWYMDELKI